MSEPWVGAAARRVRRRGRARRQRRRRSPLPAAARRRRARRRRATRPASRRAGVLTIGGIEPRKGSLTLLEGFAGLRERAARAPPGAARRRRRDAVRLPRRGRALPRAARGARPRTTTCACSAAVTDASSSALYRAADVFAFPSVKEGFGLAALEALAAGLPVVASDLDVFAAFLRRRRERAAGAGRRRGRAGRGAGARRRATPGSRSGCAAGGPARRRELTLGRAPRPRTSAAYARLQLATARSGACLKALAVDGHLARRVRDEVEARGHAIAVDEPVDAGGGDTGRDADRAASARRSRAASAWRSAFAARKRGARAARPAGDVTAERAGRELRYERFEVDDRGRGRARRARARWSSAARPLCWVSNTPPSGVSVEYRYTTPSRRIHQR